LRCFFLKQGHIAAVEILPGLSQEQAVDKSRELFAARKDQGQYEGFEVWEEARMVIQYPPPPTQSDARR
jgi:hypothetical protein